eukprot:TRINITY_DN40120_c0_g1_i1.p1 TRINITY_DN40120_c0_g1~~TRINITY_DN40120_c0_g1_i1.p1  ORF type:complete len:252 (+),score=32.92 TRINITY_DN40120_c0_g1_i1:34-756(+)
MPFSGMFVAIGAVLIVLASGHAPTCAVREDELATSFLQLDSIVLNPDPQSGIWEAEDLEGRANGGLNECVADYLLESINSSESTSIADYGAGSGAYAVYLKNHGVNNVSCYDGNEAIVNTSNHFCSVLDLSVRQPLPVVDILYSLEVGEHIPPEREQAFLDNLVQSCSKVLILSWAIPGQAGNGHVNLLENNVVIAKMEARGALYSAAQTDALREKLSGPLCVNKMNSRNFMKTIMVFTM